jgi:hypothetical protein
MKTPMTDLRYPIGKYSPEPYSDDLKRRWLNDLAQLPNLLEASILNLDEAQLHAPYRPDGWTVQQLVHHVADSHINAFCRMKLVLSEDKPTVKPYHENLWAQQADVALPVNISITLLHALHLRMHALMKAVTDDQWQRSYIHPESGKEFTLWFLLGLYAWHGKHHTAHITSMRERMGW